GDRAGHRPEHHRLSRSARRHLVGRPTRSDRRHRPGDHGRPPRAAPAVGAAAVASPLRMGTPGIAWRFAVLGGGSAGLALSPAVPAGSAGLARGLLGVGRAAGLGLVAVRPGDHGGARGVWLTLLALATAALGLALGALRLAAIDGGAFHGPTGRPATALGFGT